MIFSPIAMPRLPRYMLPDQPQHVIQRGNNRAPIFAAEEDYCYFYEKLVNACSRFDCSVQKNQKGHKKSKGSESIDFGV